MWKLQKIYDVFTCFHNLSEKLELFFHFYEFSEQKYLDMIDIQKQFCHVQISNLGFSQLFSIFILLSYNRSRLYKNWLLVTNK